MTAMDQERKLTLSIALCATVDLMKAAGLTKKEAVVVLTVGAEVIAEAAEKRVLTAELIYELIEREIERVKP